MDIEYPDFVAQKRQNQNLLDGEGAQEFMRIAEQKINSEKVHQDRLLQESRVQKQKTMQMQKDGKQISIDLQCILQSEQLFKHLMQELSQRCQNQELAKKASKFIKSSNQVQELKKQKTDTEKLLNESKHSLKQVDNRIDDLNQKIESKYDNIIPQLSTTIQEYWNSYSILFYGQFLKLKEQGKEYATIAQDLKNVPQYKQDLERLDQKFKQFLAELQSKNDCLDKTNKETQNIIKNFFDQIKARAKFQQKQRLRQKNEPIINQADDSLFMQVSEAKGKMIKSISQYKGLQQQLNSKHLQNNKLKLELSSQKQLNQMKISTVNNLRYRLSLNFLTLDKNAPQPNLVQKTRENGYPKQPFIQLKQEPIYRKVFQTTQIRTYQWLWWAIALVWSVMIITAFNVLK